MDDELCYGKRCTANEHCCPGSVCVDVDGGNVSSNLILHPFLEKKIKYVVKRPPKREPKQQ